MPNSPTIVSAALSDKELQDSINKMVANFDKGLQDMLDHSNKYVEKIQESLQKIGSTNFGAKGSNDGGVAKQTKAQNADTDAIEKNIAARDKQIKKNQEAATSFDNFAKAQQVAIRSASPSGIRNAEELQTMNIQLDLLRERLREARQQYSSFVALAAHATTTGDKGLFQYATEGVHRYEQEVRNLIPQIRTLQSGIQQMGDVIAPQGHTIQNYVNSLQKANPELAQLNEQFKRGKSLLQQQKTEFELNAQAQRSSANATNQQKKTLDEMNAYIRQNIQREQERRDAIRQTGLAAQDAFTKIRQNAQIQLAENTDKPIKGIKELSDAITNMRRLYFDMSTAERESPLGLALKRDIENAQKLKIAIDAYNRTLTGMSVLGTKNNANSSLGAYTELTNILKTLSDEYKRLGREERNAAKGNDLADKIQRLSRETQKIQQQMNRPISFVAAMKGDEKTLDDIAYKMQRLRAYRQGIDLTKPNAANEIKQVDEALAKLQKDADKWMSKSQEMIKNNTALGRSWNYMKNRLAFYFTVGASTQFIKNLIEVRSQYEMNERALGILINSAERGTQIFNELSQMALVSPYTLIELSAAAKQLTAYDVAAKDVVDTTRRLADMASAVGIPIERLTYALGQIKAYGYLNSRDARMFANAGIPLVKQLADYYTELEGKLVSTADIYDRIKKKTIGYNDVMSVMYKMTDEGGKFFDFQAKMADTLKVRLANLTLAWNNMLNDMGKESQGVLTWGIGALRELFLQWRTFDKTLKEAAGAFGLYKVIQLIILGLQTATKSTLGLNARLTATGVLGTRLVTIFKALGSAMKSLAANWWLVLVAAAVELSSAIINANEATKEFNKSMREGAESTANDLKKYIEQYKDLRDSLYKTQTQTLPNGKTKSTLVPQDIDKNEASKAWETMREQIELSSAASTDFVSRLLQIENVSDRLRDGFKIIDDIQQVNAALKDMGDEALVVTQKWSAWWNAWQAPDGLFTNLKEFKVELDEIRQKYGDIANARYVAEHGDSNRAADEQDAIMRAASEAVNDYDREMNRFRVDLDKYTSSLDNFANAMEFSSNPTQVAELYAKAVKQLVTQGQLNPQEAFDLQLQIEEARTNAMKLALHSRIADEESALKLAQDERTKESLNASIESNKAQLKLFENSTYEQTAYWNDFTKYIKERHISELTAAYNAMTENGKKEMDFQSVEWQKYVHKWANSYEKSHNLATDSVFNRIKNWINDANTWSIFIKMTISTEDKKSVYKQLGEYDKAVDEADAQIERLTKRIGELNAKKKKSKEETQELANAEQELADAQKAKTDAEAKGGHGKKEKKDEKAANKAAKQAETELQKALKDELSTIEKVRSIYKDLTKEGMSHANAVERATRSWGETVNAINRVLQKNGLQKLDLSKFAGIENPRELVNMLQSQLNTLLKRGAKPAEIKELQTKVNTLEVDADKYDLTKITKGLNNELDRLKEEYELAVELDANPEMGNLFADWMGVDMSALPHTAEEYAKRMTKALNKYLADEKSGIEIGDLLALTDDDLRMFQQRVDNGELTQVWVDNIVKNTKEARNALKKENSNIAKEWDSLIQKYAEYEYKISQVQRNANKERKALALKYGTNDQKERALVLTTEIDAEKDQAKKQELINQLKQLLVEIAGDNESILKINTAINKKELEEGAKVSFEEFQKSPEWIVATGDLAGMTNKAIGGLINSIEEYKKKAKHLDAKQVKNLNSALRKLYKQQREGNPFLAISNAIDQAKARMEDIQPALDSTMSDIIKLEKEIGNTEPTEEQAKALDKLKKKWKELYEVGQISASDIVNGINSAIDVAVKASDSFNKMAEALGGTNMTKAAKTISDITGNLQAAGQGAAAGAQISGGNGWAAAAGATVGGLTDLVTRFAEQWSGNKSQTERVKEVEDSVGELELAYIDLEHAVDKAMGTAVLGAKQAALANKQAQLESVKRQLELEKERDSKYRDSEKILSLEKQYKELFNEIQDGYTELVDTIMGTDVSSFAENLVSSMITAFKQGEDYMKVFGDKFDEMIDNMIMKSIVSRVVASYLNKIWDAVDERINNRAKEERDAYEKTQALSANTDVLSDDELRWNLAWDRTHKKRGNDASFWDAIREYDSITEDDINKYVEAIKAEEKAAKTRLEAATEFTDSDIDFVMSEINETMPELGEKLKDILGQYYKFGESSDKNLSALQQGLQSMSEDTGSALESYMNGVSQQVYYHSSLLEQIRDSVVGLDLDVSLGVQSQMLLQLQNSYQTQQAIQQILEGVLVPSGRAFAVELLS